MSDPTPDPTMVAAAPGSPSKPPPRLSRVLLRDLVRPHHRGIGIVMLAGLVQVISAMTAPLLIGVAIDTALPSARTGDYRPLALVTLGLVVSALLAGWLRFVFVKRAGVVGQAILFELRRRIFVHVQSLSVSFHERFTSGRVISRLTSDVDTLNDLLDAGLDGLITALMNMVIITIVMLVLDVPMALLAVAALLPLMLLFRWFARRATPAFAKTRDTVSLVIVNFVETFNGIRAVQAFRAQRRNEATFDKLNTDYRAANATAFRLQALLIPGTSMIGNVATVLVLVVGAHRVATGGLELGVLTSFILYLRQFYDPMDDVAVFYNSLQSASAALEKIAQVLAEEPSVAPPGAPVTLAEPVRGEVELNDVQFGYVDATAVLPALDLHIRAGETLALVGATGAGKSTIAKLISRFYDPSSGSVRLDGTDLRDIAEHQFRSAVVMITQDGFLFSGSVGDNIAFGSPGATRAEVVRAAEAVGAHEFISRLPEGYDTDVRKRGGRLSAGQRQLIAFSRAFLADPAVLILDEATSSLDVPTERAVQRALRTVLRSRTALIIAHRLSTVEIADRVVVLSGGRVIEDGTPAELIAHSGGQFASLHSSWRDSLV
ncbi:ABC-type multidrug transport system fused ATPase/permease subunit [Jatrophihabitans sp. GAS493]|uniref:ABC transporter ATP-binding protein n=1 Tax=Jatrophihabitans sp. GAS493 TaxID=1907575 RepID=UPI000BB79A77|nr:ABC transporter ATP-binding protein [Jatrophihabitans sp. GAS493]SOD70422.1 ABC-type multidrug transport system fused ATPase/permease subunit [Jatrophihabitans sp. GAS493]